MSKREDDRPLVGMYDFLDAVEAAIKSAAPAERNALAKIIEHYCVDFPDEFFWATGPQAPTLLNHLMLAVTPDGRDRTQELKFAKASPAGTA
jgi:hypothetical protein